jgi:hypothetical protein
MLLDMVNLDWVGMIGDVSEIRLILRVYQCGCKVR